MNQRSTIDQAECPLSPKDIEIISWASVGKTADETAEIIGSSIGAVRRRIQRATEKTGAVNATSLVAIALRSGWIE
jgi:LuxR family quorum sensing-dependent transcriptional regulator